MEENDKSLSLALLDNNTFSIRHLTSIHHTSDRYGIVAQYIALPAIAQNEIRKPLNIIKEFIY